MQTEGEIYSEGVSSIEGGYESGSVEGNMEEKAFWQMRESWTRAMLLG